jgi:hypothetical protein
LEEEVTTTGKNKNKKSSKAKSKDAAKTVATAATAAAAAAAAHRQLILDFQPPPPPRPLLFFRPHCPASVSLRAATTPKKDKRWRKPEEEVDMVGHRCCWTLIALGLHRE